MSRKIIIDPITRIEGYGKVTIFLDDEGHVHETRLNIAELRGFEKFIQGRPYWEVPVLVQRLCGICPVSHHIAGAKAVDEIVGLKPESAKTITLTSEKLRRLMHYGQVFQSHATHFFYLASPDLLLGIDAPVAQRNIVGLIKENKELAKRGILMRKFGQEIIKAVAGKKIHGISAVPGGIHKNLTKKERDYFLNGKEIPNIDKIIEWSQEGLGIFKKFHKDNKDWVDKFSTFPSSHMSLVRNDGALDFYHGRLRVIDSKGNKILDDVDYHDYLDYIGEEVKSWSHMKFPFLKSLGPQKGWYRVGSLARLNVCDFIPSPLAQKELDIFRDYTKGKPNDMTLHYHWARLIETLHCAEVMKDLLNDSQLQKTDLVTKGKKTHEGIGVIEAPRGTLFHHYKTNDHDQINFCNLIVATTHNNEAINKAIASAAYDTIAGKKKITEPMLNAIEVSIRAYDPCLSCATHALGQMPLNVSMFDEEGKLIDKKIK